MNDLTPLEKQLESWTPRRPSVKLRHQLFPAAPVAKPAPPVSPVSLWLATAAACLFMLAVTLLLPHRARTTALAASGASNLIASLSMPDGSCQQWNLWSVVTFDWTKTGSSLSITAPFGLGKTNL